MVANLCRLIDYFVNKTSNYKNKYILKYAGNLKNRNITFFMIIYVNSTYSNIRNLGVSSSCF